MRGVYLDTGYTGLDVLRDRAALLQGAKELRAGGVGHADGGAVVPDADDLGQDADGDLGRGAGGDVDADRRFYLGQVIEGHALVLQQLEDGEHAPPAADHADVGQRLLDDFAQRQHVVPVAARDEHHEARGRQVEAGDRLLVVAHDDLV